MDTQLFMECEEEELEPWQLVDDSVESDDDDYMNDPFPSDTPPPVTPAATVPFSVRAVSSSSLVPPLAASTVVTSSSQVPFRISLAPPPTMTRAIITPPTNQNTTITNLMTPFVPATLPHTNFTAPALRNTTLFPRTITHSTLTPPRHTRTTMPTIYHYNPQGTKISPMVTQATPLVTQTTPPMSITKYAAPTLTHYTTVTPPVANTKQGQPGSMYQTATPLVTTQATPLPLMTSQSQAVTSQSQQVMSQAPPLILTRMEDGTFLLPASHGGGTARPFFLTTQGFPVQMNPGAPLVLNLRPGQTMQPLTLIPSSSLGQLVRPSVCVSAASHTHTLTHTHTHTQPGASHTAKPGASFSAMQPQTMLTIRTSTPGQAAPVPAHSVIAQAPPPRVVMTVDEFYYGTSEGDLRVNQLKGGITSFTCNLCEYRAANNLRLMQHMLQHSSLIGARDEIRGCRFCYRQFSSPKQLQTHKDQVHGANQSPCMCGICEWAFENEPTFLNHMKSNHKPGEMPYVCQVCCYRSSFYNDVLQHFASYHGDSRCLLCVFCLRVTRNPASYQQHLLRHTVDQAFHCNRCRLQFVYLKDKMQHKLENHRSYRRPAQLEGLPPGSKVTIRTYGKVRPPVMTSSESRPALGPAPTPLKPINIKTEQQWVNSISQSLKKLRNRTPNTSVNSSAAQENRPDTVVIRRSVCLECGTEASDWSAHYPTHVGCLLCSYRSCCSRAYADHMIHHHVPRPKDKVVPPLHRLPPPCVFLLQCTSCDFRPQTADKMADHLVKHPEHYSATCRERSFIESDIRFCPDKQHRLSKLNRQALQLDAPLGPSASSWSDPDNWKTPYDHWKKDTKQFKDKTPITINPFTQTTGPRHTLNKNSDAIDFFNMMFPAVLVELIANETNAHAKMCKYLGAGTKGWVPVSTHEIKGFIGIVILMGIQSLPDPSLYWNWAHYENSYSFQRAMSYQRYTHIALHIRPGSLTTEAFRDPGTPQDSLSIFRPMLAMLGRAMWNSYLPNCCLTVDRALLPRMEEKQDPQSHALYATHNTQTQPQVWLLADSKSGYCHRFFIQAAEMPGEDPCGFSVVSELVRGLEDKHHQLFLSSSLCSAALMKRLLDQGIYSSSSFPPPSPILPAALWEDGQLIKAGEFVQRQCGPLLATRWKDLKETGCLSTNALPGHADTVWRRSTTKPGELSPISRPQAFCLLQENMRGVDIVKQLLACNPLGGVTMDTHCSSLFWFLVNLSIVNSFIVLRESRKDSPPFWVRAGLFTQLSFRMRLGNQLMKCAQSYTEAWDLANSVVRPVAKAGLSKGDPPIKELHRMVKISSISKRCKNCHKRRRRESVYGCIICKTNLCTAEPDCFWESHGLSPRNKGSTKVGFVKNIITGEVEFQEVLDTFDPDMAPIEDMDFSDHENIGDEDENSRDIKQEFIENENENDIENQNQPITPSERSPHQRIAMAFDKDSLNARQLRIALFALCDGLRQAARIFAADTQDILTWLKEARQRLKLTEQERSDGTDRMVAWVLSMREQQLPITESSLFAKASTLKKKGGFSDSFRISYDWAVSFMLQNRLGVRSIGKAATIDRTLPNVLEGKIETFRKFTRKIIKANSLAENAVVAMDELSLFVDLRLVLDKSRRSQALELTGSVPLVTVYLSVLADGTMLPSLVLANRQLTVGKILPAFIVLGEGTESSLVEDEALEMWTKKVWLPHVSKIAPSKSMLVLDRHREHFVGDTFLASLSGLATLPAVIPGGCSFRLQPLDICGKPVLQRYLLSRWAQFVNTGNPIAFDETSPHRLQANVAELLVDWTVAALIHLHTDKRLWKSSFGLTGIVENVEMDTSEDRKEAEKCQLELIKSLTEKLLGGQVWENNSGEMIVEFEDNVEDVTQEKMEADEDDNSSRGVGGTASETNATVQPEVATTEEGKDTMEDMNERKVTQETESVAVEMESVAVETESVAVETESVAVGTESVAVETADSDEEVKTPSEETTSRRETRIEIGEQVGDEWKIAVQSKTEGEKEEEES